ncbi:MAG: hypothetical protein M0Q15_00630 [Nevskia sp.]|jgi:hypothetical protein|nr:hypothetical protein [Nevskia sp.]
MNEQENLIGQEIDFDVLEVSEATAIEEMGASSTIAAGSTCSKQTA